VVGPVPRRIWDSDVILGCLASGGMGSPGYSGTKSSLPDVMECFCAGLGLEAAGMDERLGVGVGRLCDIENE
jgi:hypothetical protein